MVRVLLGLFILMMSLVPAVVGQSTPRRITEVTIHVNVVVTSGRAAPDGILVELRNQTGAEISRQMTDSRGKVDFPNLSPAPYILAIHQTGYVDRPVQVDMTYSPSQTVYLELISTKPPAPENVPPGGPNDAISANLPASDEGKKALELGKASLFEKQDAAGSLEFFKKLNKSDPDYANGWVLTGTALMALKKDDEAEKAFRMAVKKAPESYSANFGLGVELNQLGRFEEAIQPLKKSLGAKPDSVEALYEISRSHLALNRWQDAEPNAAKAIALAPTFAPVHVSMGNIYLRKRDAVSALKEFETYLKLEPNGPFAPQTLEIANKIKAALKIN
jgi:Flp pilus assembly protein TadD